MNRWRWMVLAAAAALAVTGIVAAAGPSAAEDTVPTVGLDRGEAAPGESVRVTGSRWPGDVILQIELCGNNALNGSRDCDREGAQTTTTNADGEFSARLHLAAPPAPCPCVVSVTTLAATRSVRFPIQLLGAEVAKPVADDDLSARGFDVERVRVEGGGGLASLIGAGGERTLVVVVRNTGAVAATPRVTATWGRSEPTTSVRSVEGELVEPGEQHTIRLPFRLPALSIGEYSVSGTVHGGSGPVRFDATMTAWPWLLFAAALILVQLVLLWLRNRLRSRLYGGTPPPVDGTPPSEDTSEVDGVADAPGPGPDAQPAGSDARPEPVHSAGPPSSHAAEPASLGPPMESVAVVGGTDPIRADLVPRSLPAIGTEGAAPAALPPHSSPDSARDLADLARLSGLLRARCALRRAEGALDDADRVLERVRSRSQALLEMPSVSDHQPPPTTALQMPGGTSGSIDLRPSLRSVEPVGAGSEADHPQASAASVVDLSCSERPRRAGDELDRRLARAFRRAVAVSGDGNDAVAG